MSFSRRHGYELSVKMLQTEGIDGELRNRLWNAVELHFWSQRQVSQYKYKSLSLIPEHYARIFRELWHNFYKLPLDTLPYEVYKAIQEVRHFYFESPWHKVYDFLEFLVSLNFSTDFAETCNIVLKEENSGFRFVSGLVTPITSPEEIESIEFALESTTPYDGVREHLKTALLHITNKESPDYRNSIKESISSIEALSRVLTGNDKATLGDALKTLESDKSLHPALKKAFSALYGYTSDSGGIRHAMLEENKLTLTDAKFFLVACSAFINYSIGIAIGD